MRYVVIGSPRVGRVFLLRQQTGWLVYDIDSQGMTYAGRLAVPFDTVMSWLEEYAYVQHGHFSWRNQDCRWVKLPDIPCRRNLAKTYQAVPGGRFIGPEYRPRELTT